MPFREVSVMEQKEEFVRLASIEDVNVRELCRRTGISRTTGYLWLNRYRSGGKTALEDRSRRPHRSPNKTPDWIEEAIVELRQRHPAWGGRKLRARLVRTGLEGVPAASTITEVLRRHKLLDPAETEARLAPQRFEAPFPNDLWQMDYKGHFPLAGKGRCHPLTVLDDHTRFDIGLRALPDQRGLTVKNELIRAFQRYGLPNRILCDNSSPWGCWEGTHTALSVWLMHLDVVVIHGRPWHPQTQGKEERFHRTLERELLSTRTFDTLFDAQYAFDEWRHLYNHLRPHEALGMVPPIDHYRASPRSYPETLPAIEYSSEDLVRTVRGKGEVTFKGRRHYIGEGFRGYPIAFRATDHDSVFNVYFRHYWIRRLDIREAHVQ